MLVITIWWEPDHVVSKRGWMLALAAALMATVGSISAHDEARYPNWKGEWNAINPPLGPNSQIIKFDPTKPSGPGQQAPLTPEYQKVLEDSMADQANGGLGNYPTARCLPGGMPRTMASPRLEFVITSEATYILGGAGTIENRRIYHRRARLAERWRGRSLLYWLFDR